MRDPNKRSGSQQSSNGSCAALSTSTAEGRATPDQWAGRLSGPADYSSDRARWPMAQLKHWTGTSPDMDQPTLDHHYIVQHLGGAKKVDRRHDGAPVSAVVECGALTVVPMGTQFKWSTRGPIEFAHLYVSPELLKHTAARFDRANQRSLIDRVGCRDPLLEALYGAMLAEIQHRPHLDPLYLDCLLESFLLRLLREHSTASPRSPQRREALSPFRLKRVLDYIESQLAGPVALADLAAIAGGSIFHFGRAFKNTAGVTPYNYVLRRRIDRAKLMLTNTDLPLATVANVCGFHHGIHLSKTFARLEGITPTRYRREEQRHA